MNTDHEPAAGAGNRLKSEIRVFYGPDRKAMLSGFSVDLSTGGLYLKTEVPLQVEECLTLLFTLPGEDRSISCNVRVAWVNSADKPRKPELPPGVGLQFVDLSLEAMKAIRRFLEHNEIVPTW